MAQQHGFEFRGCDLEAADFDELFFAVDDVPEFGLCVAENDVAGVVEAVLVEGGVGGWVVEVAWDYGGAADAEFAGGVVSCNFSALVVD
jgi:hypothetical protein